MTDTICLKKLKPFFNHKTGTHNRSKNPKQKDKTGTQKDKTGTENKKHFKHPKCKTQEQSHQKTETSTRQAQLTARTQL